MTEEFGNGQGPVAARMAASDSGSRPCDFEISAARYASEDCDEAKADRSRIEQRAGRAGGIDRHRENHVTEGLHPIRRMLQGAVLDPFGHLWLIGKFLD